MSGDVNSLEQLGKDKLLKDISNIKFVLFLMMEHKSNKVPADEVNKITNTDILLWCKYSEEMLLKLFFEKEEAWTRITSRQDKPTTTLSGKAFSVFLHPLNM